MSGFSPTTSFFVFFLPLNSSYYSHEYFQIISYTHSYSIGMTDFRICNKWYVHVAFLLWNKCLCLPSLQNSYAEAQYPIRWKLWAVLTLRWALRVRLPWWDRHPCEERKTEGPLSTREDPRRPPETRKRRSTRNRLCGPLSPASPQHQGEEAPAWGALWRQPNWLQPSAAPGFSTHKALGLTQCILDSFAWTDKKGAIIDSLPWW